MSWFGKRDKPVSKAQQNLQDFHKRYAGDVPSSRYSFVLETIGQRLRMSVQITYVCSSCGACVVRNKDIDGVQLHEDWHWRVDRVAGVVE